MAAKRQPGKPKLQMVHLRLEPELIERLDEYRWDARFEDRTKLVRYLLNWALDNHPKPRKKGS